MSSGRYECGEREERGTHPARQLIAPEQRLVLHLCGKQYSHRMTKAVLWLYFGCAMAVPWLYFGCTMAVHCGNTYLGPHEVDVRRQHGERVCRLVYHAVEAAQRGRHLHGVAERSASGSRVAA